MLTQHPVPVLNSTLLYLGSNVIINGSVIDGVITSLNNIAASYHNISRCAIDCLRPAMSVLFSGKKHTWSCNARSSFMSEADPLSRENQKGL